MKKLLVVMIIMMLALAAGVSMACEDTPIVMASAAYTTANPDRTSVPSNTFKDSDGGIEFVHVTGGCYCMGAADEAATRDATPAHQVCVDDYYMGKFEVTQAQWREIMGSNPSTLSACGDNCPVVDVSWHDVQEFTRRLSERTGKIYRLPTEAEWEHAARIGGAQEKITAHSESTHEKRTLRPVGMSQPNDLGIYDMQGSVWEWTADKYRRDYYGKSPMYNPEGPQVGLYRVLRGGSWDDTHHSIQPTARASYEPWIKRSWVGFRLVSPDQTSAKFRGPEVLAIKDKANEGGHNQCQLPQQAQIR